MYFDTLFLEVKVGCQDSTLMVAPEQKYVIRVNNFVGQQQSHDFDIESASIDIVPKEQIFCFIRGSVVLENRHKIEKLSILFFMYPWISPTTEIGDCKVSRLG
jgi:hypothetical protein